MFVKSFDKVPFKITLLDQHMLFEDIALNKLLRNLIFSKNFPLDVREMLLSCFSIKLITLYIYTAVGIDKLTCPNESVDSAKVLNVWISASSPYIYRTG